MKNSKGVNKAAVPAGPDINVPDQGNKTEKHYNDLVALSRVSAAISGLQDLDTILRIGLDNVLNIMNGTVGGIMLLDESGQTLSYRVHHGLSDKYAEEMHLKLGEGIAGKVAQSGRAVLLEDISSESDAARLDLISSEGLRAFVSVPLRAKDIVLGVMNVASHVPHRFSKEDVHLLHTIGDQLGIAIEQAVLYDRLRKARERLRKLARQNLVAEEEERRRIARELHDETSQSLSGIALQLEALIEIYTKSGSQDPQIIAGLKKVQALTVQVHKEVSRVISNLHPTVLDTLGLVAAARQHAKNTLQPLNINATVEVKGTEMRFPPDVEAALFRVIQGSVGNIIKHSKAKNASIVLAYQPDEFSLTIRDDGQGFDVSRLTDVEASGRGRGLFSMRERIGFLGGTSGVESEIGAGTTIWAKIPIGQDIRYDKNKSTDN
ncbi:MAG: GAF domain-containing sensor histidine kinase [Dehalococcoidia bacterium]|nr:GAF domain-containing sensor histidine kinase [Dehalococcoidia bacterium]MDH4299556.1 GAF domain-containing sensor histidine kinase [Dehalococcoidia bacterium]